MTRQKSLRGLGAMAGIVLNPLLRKVREGSYFDSGWDVRGPCTELRTERPRLLPNQRREDAEPHAGTSRSDRDIRNVHASCRTGECRHSNRHSAIVSIQKDDERLQVFLSDAVHVTRAPRKVDPEEDCPCRPTSRRRDAGLE